MNAWPRMTLLAAGLVLGIGIGGQTRTSLAIRTNLRVTPPHLEELGYRLRRQERVTEALEAQVHEIRGRIAAYQTAAAERQEGLSALHGQLETLRTLAGMTPLEGPGVVVELDDSRRPLLRGENQNEVILHNFDVATVVNDLWVAGAEAIALNGERLVATTGIQSLFRTFRVNSKRITPPLSIAAIGDPRLLAGYVSRRGGSLDSLRAFAFPVRVTRVDRLTIPAYKGAFVFRHHQPAGPK